MLGKWQLPHQYGGRGRAVASSCQYCPRGSGPLQPSYLNGGSPAWSVNTGVGVPDKTLTSGVFMKPLQAYNYLRRRRSVKLWVLFIGRGFRITDKERSYLSATLFTKLPESAHAQ